MKSREKKCLHLRLGKLKILCLNPILFTENRESFLLIINNLCLSTREMFPRHTTNSYSRDPGLFGSKHTTETVINTPSLYNEEKKFGVERSRYFTFVITVLLSP